MSTNGLLLDEKAEEFSIYEVDANTGEGRHTERRRLLQTGCSGEGCWGSEVSIDEALHKVRDYRDKKRLVAKRAKQILEENEIDDE
ncbi:MAG: hypothetical protein J6Z22_03340 [Lachnospiraceae bacterium]|nr:hypothetical protein [Lachnospiraceae bacterium]